MDPEELAPAWTWWDVSGMLVLDWSLVSAPEWKKRVK